MRRRPKHAGARAIRRNAVLVLLAIAVLAVLIVVAARVTSRPVLIMPPESPERIAQRQAPENAYFTFVEAEKLMPPLPSPAPLAVPSEKDPKIAVPYRPEKGSAGEMLGIGRPDDDPLLVDYLKQCEPAIAKMREALGQSYCLLPVKWSDFEDFNASYSVMAGYTKPLATAGRILTARGIFAARTKNDPAESLPYLLDALRVGRMAAADGGRLYEPGIQGQALTRIPEVAHTAPREALLAMLGELKPLAAAVPSLLPNFEFRWRILDHNIRAEARSKDSAQRLLENLGMGMYIRQLKRDTAARKEELSKAVELPYREFMQWRNHQADRDRSNLLWETTQTVWAQSQIHVYYQGALLATAIEIYQRDNNAYPETLDTLIPTYFDAPPEDALSGAPFAYRKGDGDYTLYSIGANGKDENGSEGNRTNAYMGPQRTVLDDIPIHPLHPLPK